MLSKVTVQYLVPNRFWLQMLKGQVTASDSRLLAVTLSSAHSPCLAFDRERTVEVYLQSTIKPLFKIWHIILGKSLRTHSSNDNLVTCLRMF